MSHATHSSHENTLPLTVSASLEARLAPFHASARAHPHLLPLEDIDFEVSAEIERPQARGWGVRFIDNVKLLVAALGAGNAVVPMGDNGATTRELAAYARRLEAARRWN
jgi:hypothetical protein